MSKTYRQAAVDESRKAMKMGDLFMNGNNMCMWIGKHKNVCTSTNNNDPTVNSWFMIIGAVSDHYRGGLFMHDPMVVNSIGVNIFDVMRSAALRYIKTEESI